MPGPSTPKQASLTKGQLAPPKVSGTGDSYGPPAPGSEAFDAATATDHVTQSWRTLVTSFGEAAPFHVNRIRRATHHLRSYGG